MRARDFLREDEEVQGITIKIPITISFPINGGEPIVGTIAAPAGTELPEQPVMVPPLQQSLELEKQQGGKRSRVINQIVSNDDNVPRTGDKQAYYNVQEDLDALIEQFDLLNENTGGGTEE